MSGPVALTSGTLIPVRRGDGRTAPSGPLAVARLHPPFLATPAVRRRARAAAGFLAGAPHPGIVPLLDRGEEPDGTQVTVVPHAPGGDLARGALPWRAALDAVARVADALSAAHDRGVLHRDVTPGNVLRGPAGTLWLADWDSGRFPGVEPDPAERSSFGTPGYMSPEQEYGDVLDPRADLFSLGMTLWTLLSGRPPVRDGTPAPERVARVLRGLPRPTERPTPADDVAARLAAPDPAARPADARDAARLARAALA